MRRCYSSAPATWIVIHWVNFYFRSFEWCNVGSSGISGLSRSGNPAGVMKWIFMGVNVDAVYVCLLCMCSSINGNETNYIMLKLDDLVLQNNRIVLFPWNCNKWQVDFLDIWPSWHSTILKPWISGFALKELTYVIIRHCRKLLTEVKENNKSKVCNYLNIQDRWNKLIRKP